VTAAPPTCRLPRHKQAVLSWLAIYPSITLALWLLQPLGLEQLPLPVRTLALTVLLVPAMVYVLMPALAHVLRSWLR